MYLGILVLISSEFMIAAFCFIVLFSPGFGGGVVMSGAVLREYFGVNAHGRRDMPDYDVADLDRMWVALPRKISAASPSVSDRVGCG